MTAMILDEQMTERLIAERRRLGLDNHDEVWDGVYVMSHRRPTITKMLFPTSCLYSGKSFRVRRGCNPGRT